MKLATADRKNGSKRTRVRDARGTPPAPTTDLQVIASTVVRCAQRQGSLLPQQIRKQLAEAGVPGTLWKDVAALARASLSYRKGRYYYVPPVSERVRQEQEHQRMVRQAVEHLIAQHRSDSNRIERRERQRIDFVQPLKARGEDGRTCTLLSRDLSVSGIRLIGTRSLLGQKIHVELPNPGGPKPWCFLVRILWTCALGEDMYENGGIFVSAAPGAIG